MTEARRIGDNGGSRPVPDPTVLTDAAISKAIDALTDYVNGQLAVRDERLRGIDEATKLRLEAMVDYSPEIDTKVTHLERLHGEKFRSVDQRFIERDTRSENEKRDSKVAVDAAFAASKEASSEQNKSNTLAITKSEIATTETINKLAELFRTTTDGLGDKIDDLKDRVNRIESVKVGGIESRTGLYAAIGVASTVFFLALAILGFLAVQP